jgi:hypothetical protein
MNNWIKVDTTSNENSTHDFRLNPEITGIYAGQKTNLGANGSTLYEVKTPTGIVSFWGSTVIDNKMKHVPLGNEILVKFLGEVKNDKTKRTYKDFDVFHKPASKPMDVVTNELDWSTQ